MLPRETRVCQAPGCSRTFVVPVTSKQKFCCPGHAFKGKTHSEEVCKRFRCVRIEKAWSKKNLTPREERCCFCGCRQTFICLITSNRRYFSGHNKGFLGKHPTEEQKKAIGRANSGIGNGQWKGGVSKQPYPFEFHKNLKEEIFQRDGWVCWLCGTTSDDGRNKLCVHHIDYVKANLLPGNLITLCRDCNLRVNQNRLFWGGFLSYYLFLWLGM